jgi:TolB-like protein
MSSIIEGYNYDIFISYRQKDNKHDGWVTEFVDNLKGELESTFKEEISVYFDINPHDGLLETHDVDASLKDKLKCLVFIPIISRTYCDPKSFAWEHEFKAFIDLASQDQYGLKVKLPGGNVASRVLPVRIHDLDAADIKECESVLGGVLRGVEFIYKEPGVNRPLKPDDDEKINLNKTKYRNQINKVGNAINEIISGLKTEHVEHSKEKIQHGEASVIVKKEERKEVQEKPAKLSKRKLLTLEMVLAVLLIIAGIIIYPKIFKQDKPGNLKSDESAEKSIAVLPFKLLSDEPDKQFLADAMMDAITLHLSKIKDLRVMSRTSVEQYRGTTKTTRQIGKELGVQYLLEGSFQKFGDDIKLIVQVIKSSEESHVWANEYSNKWSNVFSLQSEVAQKIANELNAVISPEEKQIIEKIPTKSMIAYNYYLRGMEELYKFGTGSINREAVKKAEDLFRKALENDSSFAQGYAGLGIVYWKKAYYEENYSKHFRDSSLGFANIALSYNDKLADGYVIRAGYYAEIGSNIKKAIEELDKAIRFDPNFWSSYHEKGKYYWFEGDLVKEIENRLKAASLNHDAQLLPELLTRIGDCFISSGFPEKAKYYYNEVVNMNNDSVSYLYQISSVESAQGNYTKSLEFLEKINTIDSSSEVLDKVLALNYMYAGQFERSLKYVKKWLDRLLVPGIMNDGEMLSIGFIYWSNGYRKEAEYYFNKQIEYSLDYIKKNGPDAWFGRYYDNYYNLAGVYAINGDKEKAYKNLRIFNDRKNYNLRIVTLIKSDPVFNSIRSEPEFQKIVRDVEAKYQAEHERVKKWLEENKMQ